MTAVATERDTAREITEKPRRPVLHHAVTLMLWLGVMPFAVWAALRLGDFETGFTWVQLVPFTPYVAVASLIPVVLALGLRRRWTLFGALVVTATLAGAVLPRALPDMNPAAAGPGLRVLAANLALGEVPPERIVELVRRQRADVLALQELTPGAVAALRKAGLTTLLPYRLVRAAAGGGGSGVYARHPVRAEHPAIEIGGFRQVRALLSVPGGPPVEVVSVHPCAPSAADRHECWAAGLRALPPADPSSPVRILAGDFNATLDHRILRDLISTGYRDAADVIGDGLTATWPYGDWPTPIPWVTLDRVLADRRVAVQDFGVFPLPGGDHRAVFAALTLPGPG
ncbi:endonuclease/exonuclease/phosphatase family protein [Rhizohabitans arisaemae]|uniref:endonuclease/exonuclease/phosphatase family protein n=1 Tax=Rhizohabitans arisaemae TaxID=2720610 RepID=UPI0024B19C07|nr:endonuclease/exonuclease/phosphatase family protein [Rhizohabitans arisaemae]